MDSLEKTVDEMASYSYSFNVKVLGLPEISENENAQETSELCTRLFASLGADVYLRDIDIAHRVPARNSSRGGPKPVVCKFTRRLARAAVFSKRKDVSKIKPTDIGLAEEDEIPSIRIVEHLVPRVQKLFSDVKAFRDRYQYEFAWVKNGNVLLRKHSDSSAIKVHSAEHFSDLVRQEHEMLIT